MDDTESRYKSFKEKYFKEILYLSYQILHRYEDAEEVAEDVLLKFINLPENAENNRGLFRIMTKHLSINRYKKTEKEYRKLYQMATETSYKRLTTIEKGEAKHILENNVFHEIYTSYNDSAIINSIEEKSNIEKLRLLIEEEKLINIKTYKIILLRFFKINDLTNKEHTLTEISDIMDMSAEAVRRRLERFFNKARLLLEGRNNEK